MIKRTVLAIFISSSSLVGCITTPTISAQQRPPHWGKVIDQPDNFHQIRTLAKLERIFAENNSMRLDNLQKIQQLAQSQKNIEIICAHDPVELERYRP